MLLQDELRQEKQNRERISREKEMALADKYTLEQNLSVRIYLYLFARPHGLVFLLGCVYVCVRACVCVKPYHLLSFSVTTHIRS